MTHELSMIALFRPLRARFGAVGVLSLGGAVFALALLVGWSLTGATAHAAFPGQNAKLVCVGAMMRPDDADDFEIYSMNPDGSGQAFLTNNGPLFSPTTPTSFVDEFDPVFSPDSQRVAFESLRTGSSEIFSMNVNGSDVKRLTSAATEDRPGSYSPDGSKIVFHSGRNDAAFEVYTMNADGSNPTRLTFQAGQDSNASWSPDGTRIAFQSSREGGDLEIFTMNTTGGDIRRVTNRPGIDAFPQWSPDGSKLVFRRDLPATPPATGTDQEIFTINADGTNPTNLTKNAVDNPATPTVNESSDDQGIWSPDGTRIAFDSFRSGDREVYTMSAANGSGVTRLTNALGFDGRCDWGRVRPASLPAPVLPTPPSYPKPPVTPPGTPSAGKLRTSLTLKARPRRDRRPPFRFTFSGRVRVPSGANRARVCGGRVRLVVKKRRRTVARGSARVSRRCTYKKRITIRSTRRTGRRKARLRVNARFGGNVSLKASKRSTSVRIF